MVSRLQERPPEKADRQHCSSNTVFWNAPGGWRRRRVFERQASNLSPWTSVNPTFGRFSGSLRRVFLTAKGDTNQRTDSVVGHQTLPLKIYRSHGEPGTYGRLRPRGEFVFPSCSARGAKTSPSVSTHPIANTPVGVPHPNCVKGGVKVSHQGGAKGDHFWHSVARCSLSLGAAGAEPCDAR